MILYGDPIMNILAIITTLVISYLAGSIPFGWIIVKISSGKDIRSIASGRTGGTNAWRAAGCLPGLLTATMDVLKGAATYFVVSWLCPEEYWLQVLSALFAVLGHNYSIFLLEKDPDGKLRLRGGAGGATVLGGAMSLWLPIVVILLPVVALVYFIIGYASITTISIAFFSLAVFAYRAYIGASPWYFTLYGFAALIIVIIALKPNLERIKKGTERVHGLRAYLLKRSRKAQTPDV
jgi:acyl phosphate:glycerol-3-phosphate acyltransferase